MGIMSSSPEQEPMDVMEVSLLVVIMLGLPIYFICDAPVVFTVLATLRELQVVSVYVYGD